MNYIYNVTNENIYYYVIISNMINGLCMHGKY
jgi:hypothetical protein